MAELFIKQAKQYAIGRPNYPLRLFEFIASKTPTRRLAWDVGTGTGQAAQSLAGIYNKVIATDTSPTQLEHATKHPNIIYNHTPPNMSTADVEQTVAPPGTVDLITVAQALHWFDLPTFYKNVKWALKKPDGVIAAWCYTLPKVSSSVDAALHRLYSGAMAPFWDDARRLVEEEYKTIEFPFEAVDGEDDTGPFEFVGEKLMSFDEYLTYLRSWSAYQSAKEKGFELLNSDVVREFQVAWNEEEGGEAAAARVAQFPIYLRIGKVGNVS